MVPTLLIFMFATGSRTAFIGFIFSLGLILYNYSGISLTKKMLLSFFTITIFILIWFAFLKNTMVAGRLFTSINEGDLSSRDLIWLAAFEIIIDNYLFGVGKTGYSEKILSIFGDIPSPHNVFVEVVCYTGILGLIVFLLFILRVVAKVRFINKIKKDSLPLVVLIAVILNLLSGQLFDAKFMWAFLAFIISYDLGNKKPLNLIIE